MNTETVSNSEVKFMYSVVMWLYATFVVNFQIQVAVIVGILINETKQCRTFCSDYCHYSLCVV